MQNMEHQQRRPSTPPRRRLAGVTPDRLAIGLTPAGHETLTALQDFYRDRLGVKVTPSYIVQTALESLAAEVRGSEPGEGLRAPSTSDGPIRPIVQRALTPKEQQERKKCEREELEQESAERYRRSHAPTEEERAQDEETRARLYAKLRCFTKGGA